jgi:hypothetical protein
MTDPAIARPALRASDADRERVANELREHAGEGRLSPEELAERLEHALLARTLPELDALVSDLPGPAPVPAAVARRARARRLLAHRAGAVAITDATCVAIWAATGADSSFWPAWVILFTGLSLVRRTWRVLGPGAGLSDAEIGEEHRAGRREHHRHRRSGWV